MSIGTCAGFLGSSERPTALAASFNSIIMATVLAASFFLLGAGLLLPCNQHAQYRRNSAPLIADLTANHWPYRQRSALLFVLACLRLVLELKPFPANGWGPDVYETAPSGIAGNFRFTCCNGESGEFF